MAAPSVVAPMMASRVITHNIRINSELAEKMDPIELSSLNELLDHIAALGVATDYDRIGLKPDQRDIRSPPATHKIVVVEESHVGHPSTLRTNYVRIIEFSKPNIYPKDYMTQVPDLESGAGPKGLGNTLDPELSGSVFPVPPGVRSDQNPASANDARSDLIRLSRVRQEPQETVRRYWARFLLALNKVKDCHKEDVVSLFCRNCTNKGLLNAISRRDIVHFTDLATIV